uniref:Oxysterol-binding protein n=2 Tax=Parascaris univalens TaxID=6257 RepID=A0A915AQ55_PARUN
MGKCMPCTDDMTGFRKRLKRSIAGHLHGRKSRGSSIAQPDTMAMILKATKQPQPFGLPTSFASANSNASDRVLSDIDELRRVHCCLDNESVLTIQMKMDDLRTCANLIGKHGNELMKTLADLEMVIGKEQTKVARERITLFKMTVKALLRGSSELMELLRKEGEKMIMESNNESHILERMRKDMDEMSMQIQLLKDAKVPLNVLNSRREGSCSEEDDDELPYFDAFSVRQMSMRQTLRRSHCYPHQKTLSSVCECPSAPTPASHRKSSTVQRGAQVSSTQPETRWRRTTVPFRPETSINYLTMMKNCIGKDLSRIAMPVNFNEPLSALQRSTEDLEYANLLHEAASLNDNYEQLAYVAAFAISAYSTVGSRSTKPFNPLLGETFEFDRCEDLGWRSIAEQVSHHPPTNAMHVEGKGWILDQSYTLTTKLKGKSLSVTPIGSTYIVFERTNNKYAYEKATTTTTVTNPLTRKLYTDNYGDVVIRNMRTDDKCLLKFHQAGYFSKEIPRKVTGTVSDSAGNSKFLIEAIWDKYAEIYRVTSDKHDNEYCDTDGGRQIWCANELPENADKMHNFTQFAIELNEPEDGVAPTDSRRRPDQRLMEEGRWDEANAVKQRLEELQRHRKSNFEKSHPGEVYSPKWFRLRDENDMTDRNDVYEYTNEYWQTKKEGNWNDTIVLFEL